MKHDSLILNIPEPCHEDWSTMTPAEKGRHCQSCNKTVVDFTRWSNQEIMNHFNNTSEKQCGRFLSSQLNVELAPPKPVKSWIKYAALLLGLVPLAACDKETPPARLPEIKMFQVPITGTLGMAFEIVSTSNRLMGQIVDAQSQLPLETEVSIELQKGEKGTTVEMGSRSTFILSDVDPEDKIIIKSPGYTTKMLRPHDFGSRGTLQIEMEERFIYQTVGIVIGDFEPDLSNESKKSTPQSLQNVENKATRGEEISAYPLPEIEIGEYQPSNAIVTGRIHPPEIRDTSFWEKTKRRFQSMIDRRPKHPYISVPQLIDRVVGIEIIQNLPGDQLENQPKTDDPYIPIFNEPETSFSVHVFPNPSQGLFTVVIPQRFEDYTLEINNVLHETIFRAERTQFDGTIDISTHPAGTYVLSIISDGELKYSQVSIVH